MNDQLQVIQPTSETAGILFLWKLMLLLIDECSGVVGNVILPHRRDHMFNFLLECFYVFSFFVMTQINPDLFWYWLERKLLQQAAFQEKTITPRGLFLK